MRPLFDAIEHTYLGLFGLMKQIPMIDGIYSLFKGVNDFVDYRIWSLVLTAGLFFTARLIEIVKGFLSERERRRRIVVAIYLEIKQNTIGLSEYRLDDSKISDIVDKIARLEPVLITSIHHNVAMQSHITEMGILPPLILQKCIVFYGALREADAAVDAVNHRYFLGISEKGRRNTAQDVFLLTRKAHFIGRKLMSDLRAHQRKWLFMRRVPWSITYACWASRLERGKQMNGGAKFLSRIACKTLVRMRVPDMFRARSRSIRAKFANRMASKALPKM